MCLLVVPENAAETRYGVMKTREINLNMGRRLVVVPGNAK